MLLARFGSRIDLQPSGITNEPAIPNFYDTVKHRFSVILSTGIKQYNRYTDKKNTVYAVTTEYCYKISHVLGFGAGLNFYYDNAVKPYWLEFYNEKATFDKIFYTTAHATSELYIGQLSFLFQPGIYLYKKFDNHRKYPFKFGFRYHFLKHYTAGILLKAHWTARADFLEFGLGYTLYKP
jgi:glycosyltransferase involved in cell wall biosynthesis